MPPRSGFTLERAIADRRMPAMGCKPDCGLQPMKSKGSEGLAGRNMDREEPDSRNDEPPPAPDRLGRCRAD